MLWSAAGADLDRNQGGRASCRQGVETRRKLSTNLGRLASTAPGEEPRPTLHFSRRIYSRTSLWRCARQIADAAWQGAVRRARTLARTRVRAMRDMLNRSYMKGWDGAEQSYSEMLHSNLKMRPAPDRHYPLENARPARRGSVLWRRAASAGGTLL